MKRKHIRLTAEVVLDFEKANSRVYVLAKSLAVVAALQLLGGQWLVLQTTAWVEMIVHYSRSNNIENAISQTFDGNHLCPFCLSIAKAKRDQQKQPGQSASGKINLVCQRAAWLLTIPYRYRIWRPFLFPTVTIAVPPSVPPPR
ncbi:MAG: hypothetical protein JOY96_00460 [Verrucomicrobia bacterium]|nr:hypothetical protein [Verrucomicrobiota bacterium]